MSNKDKTRKNSLYLSDKPWCGTEAHILSYTFDVPTFDMSHNH